MILDAIEDSHEKARCLRRFGRLGHIVVVHLAVTRRVAKYRIRASEQCPGPFLLCLHRRGVGQPAAGSEGLVDQADADGVVAGAREPAYPDPCCPQGRDDSLLALADQELRAGPGLDQRVLRGHVTVSDAYPEHEPPICALPCTESTSHR